MPVAIPIIILALPRSYSSLMCAMLGRHPQMYDLLETQIFEIDTMQEWWARYGADNHDADGLTRVVAEIIFGHQCVITISDAQEWLWERRKCTTGSVIKELGEQLYPLVMIEKTPIEGIDSQEVRAKLKRRIQTFPKARLLHLVRHPRAYGRSHLEHLAKMARFSRYPARIAKRYHRMRYGNVIDPQVLWYRVNSTIESLLRELAPEQHMRIRGEDLVAHPDAQLGEITSWLGFRSDVAAIEEMKHPDRSPFACLGPPNAVFGADPKFLRDPILRIGRPKQESLEGPLPWRPDSFGFKAEVVRLAHRFGYD